MRSRSLLLLYRRMVPEDLHLRPEPGAWFGLCDSALAKDSILDRVAANRRFLKPKIKLKMKHFRKLWT